MCNIKNGWWTKYTTKYTWQLHVPFWRNCYVKIISHVVEGLRTYQRTTNETQTNKRRTWLPIITESERMFYQWKQKEENVLWLICFRGTSAGKYSNRIFSSGKGGLGRQTCLCRDVPERGRNGLYHWKQVASVSQLVLYCSYCIEGLEVYVRFIARPS